jgi:hypothetical protein
VVETVVNPASRMWRLKRGARLGVVTGLAAVLAAGAVPASAATPPVPSSDYPPTTHLRYFPDWTNRQFDCNFGWECDAGVPFLHTRTEDQLHRVGGWAMWGEWHGDVMGFELYSSTYDPGAAAESTPWSEYAAEDEHGTLMALNQGLEAITVPAVLPCNTPGRTFAVWVNNGAWHVLFITVAWGGTKEIESAALYPLKRKWEARRYLIKQVRAAVLAAESMSASTTGFGVDGSCP